jgi:LPXTG-motif cell wall-anchored protein
LLNKYRKERKNLKMKKNVFSRTLAVLASTAVLGAASMMTANADGESVSLVGGEGTPGSVVTVAVNVACNNSFESIDIICNWEDTALKAAEAAGVGSFKVSSKPGDGVVTVVGYDDKAVADGTIATIDFTIPEDAEVGTEYEIKIGTVNTFAVFEGADLFETVPANSGTIKVVAPETEAPATTEEATTTTEAAKDEAPKTGNAGVAVAVAGLVAAGATAVVLKKRH